ncbi:MAG: FAD-dependent oxidoreductase [archaeon]
MSRLRVAVIGRGIVGSAIAHKLTPYHDVALFDMYHPPETSLLRPCVIHGRYFGEGQLSIMANEGKQALLAYCLEERLPREKMNEFVLADDPKSILDTIVDEETNVTCACAEDLVDRGIHATGAVQFKGYLVDPGAITKKLQEAVHVVNRAVAKVTVHDVFVLETVDMENTPKSYVADVVINAAPLRPERLANMLTSREYAVQHTIGSAIECMSLDGNDRAIVSTYNGRLETQSCPSLQEDDSLLFFTKKKMPQALDDALQTHYRVVFSKKHDVLFSSAPFVLERDDHYKQWINVVAMGDSAVAAAFSIADKVRNDVGI